MQTCSFFFCNVWFFLSLYWTVFSISAEGIGPLGLVSTIFRVSHVEVSMGKAANQRRNKRMKFLARLAQEKPDLFAKEWEKRLLSWAKEIKVSGANSRKQILSDAYKILSACGRETFKEYAHVTHEILFERYNPSFFISVDYCVSNYSKLEETGALYGRLREGRKKIYYQGPPV